MPIVPRAAGVGRGARIALLTAGLIALAVPSAPATGPAVAHAASSNAFLTVIFGRSLYSKGDHCVMPPGMMTIDQTVPQLAAMGIAVTAAVIPDRTLETGVNCVNGDLYPAWDDLARLRDTYGLTAVSATQGYNNLPTLPIDQQFQDSCGSLNAFIAHGHHNAWGLMAYPNNEFSTDVQTSVVSNCFAFGRTYATLYFPPGGTTNPQASMAAPWFEVTDDVSGGLCNDSAQPCYQRGSPGSPYRYVSPDAIAALLNVSSGSWTSLQFYSFVTGANGSGTITWDCSNSSWQEHWTSRFEVYCWNDFLAAMSQLPPTVTVADPATVANAWGRIPTPLVSIDSVNPGTLVDPSSSSTITWHAPENGSFNVLAGGSDCSSGTRVAGGPYTTEPASIPVAVPASQLAPGLNAVRVCLTNDAGHTGSASAALTLAPALPSVSSVSPADGPLAGGSALSITGLNFSPDASVTIGGQLATNLVVESPTTIDATTPATASPGAVDVVVDEAAGASAPTPADQFLYEAAPAISGVTPGTGPTAGGTQVVIGGVNFYADAAVTIGGVPAAGVTVNSSTSISATTPAAPGGVAGGYDIVVTEAGGTSPPVPADVFTWQAGGVQTPTSTSLTSSANPSTLNDLVTLTASVAPADATGTITFYDAGNAIGSSTVAGGVASLATAAMAAGSHTLTAVYGGDTVFFGSTSASLAQVVNPLTSSTALASSTNPSTFGQTVTFTAAITPIGASGTVTFHDGGSSIGAAPVASGTASLSTAGLNGGSHNITASYGGDVNDGPSSSGIVSEVVNPATTSTTLTSAKNPSAAGQPLTLTATVLPAANGSVTFFAGSTAIGSASVSSGTATLSTAVLSVGANSLTATFAVLGGNPNYLSSTSPVLTQNVSGPAQISPAFLAQGTSKVAVRVSGAGFQPGSTLAVSGSLVGVGSVAVSGTTTITALLSVNTAAPTGLRDVIVNIPGLGVATCAACLTIDPRPTVVGLSPSMLQTGASSVVVTISGTGFLSGIAKVSTSGPSTGVKVVSFSFVSATQITAALSVGTTATPGAYTLRVTNGDGGFGSCTGCLTVIQGPSLTAMAPNRVARGQTSAVTLSGQRFAAGLTLQGPSGVTFANISVSLDGLTITATMTVSSTAGTGSRLKITVINPASAGYGRSTGALLTVT